MMKRAAFLASTAALAATRAAAADVPGGTHFVERQSDFDAAAFERLVARPADIRQVFEAVSFHPQFLNNVKNSLNGLHFGLGFAPERIAVAIAPHGPARAFTYSEELWSKYHLGEALNLKDASGAPVTSNVYVRPAGFIDTSAGPDDERSFFQDSSIQTLQSRGVIFLTCHTAVEEQARFLVKGGFAPSGMTASDVANDLLTHLIPGTHVVPSMIAIIALLQQRYHYTYVTLTFA